MKIVAVPHLVRLIAVVMLIAGCSSTPGRDRADRPENPFKTNRDGPGGPKAPKSDKDLRLEADQLYRRAHFALVDNDYSTAIERYNQLIARYPFSDYSTQAEMEKIYAQYRNYLPDDAVTGADRFLREHPRHPHADYVQYVKGLTDAGRDEAFTDFLPLDSTKKDVTNARRAYDDFALLLQRYPNSRYDGDARRRMLFLRNRVADHELSVVKFYVKRGAYVAAAKRAENIIAEFPGAPATATALKLLEFSDRKIGLDVEANEVAKLIAANPATMEAATAKTKSKPKEVPVVMATADDSFAAPPAAVPPPRTMGQRFLGMFGFHPSPKPETVSAPATTGSPAAGQTTTDSTAVAAGTAATSAGTATATPSTMKIDPSLSKPSDSKSGDAQPAPAQPAEPQKKSLLRRFFDLFSFGGNKSQSSSTRIDKAGDTVPANTPDK